MTLYPEPHSARAVVRVTCGDGQPADAIAQTLTLSVMSLSGGVKVTNAQVRSRFAWNGCHLPHSGACGQFGPQQPAVSSVSVNTEKIRPVLAGLPDLQTTMPRHRRPERFQFGAFCEVRPFLEAGETDPRLI